MKRTRLKAYRPRPRRRKAPQEDADWWAEATIILLRRSGSHCEKCGHPLGNSAERHHRIRQRDGGDRLSNLLIVHPQCHQWITEHPEFSRGEGWIVTALGLDGDPPDPETMPVRINGWWWYLRDDGQKIPVP